MLTMIIPAVAGLLCGLWFVISNKNWQWKGLAGAPVIGSLIGLLFGLFALFITSNLAPIKWEKIDTVELVSLRDRNEISGSFFLGSGHFGETLYYFYYKKLSNGGCQYDKVKVNNNIVIYEEDRQGGLLKVFQPAFKKDSMWRWFAFPVDNRQYIYSFYIPKNSLKKEFTL